MTIKKVTKHMHYLVLKLITNYDQTNNPRSLPYK